MLNKNIKNFLPGPVDVSDRVRAAFGQGPISHRSPEFLDMLEHLKTRLLSLSGASRVEILMGSGTLANDAVAAQLSLIKGLGIMISNGEFGERLLDHASRFSLRFNTISCGWGESFKPGDIVKAFKDNPGTKWLWAVHTETSTGVLNNIDELKSICLEKGALLALDCVSSVGTVPLDLSGVYMASGVSGKGLMSYPGLAMVFHNSDILPTGQQIPRYLDLNNYSKSESVPFTISSNLVSALDAALTEIDFVGRFEYMSEQSKLLRGLLENSGFTLIPNHDHTSPSIVTISLPSWINSSELGESLEQEGFYIHHRSAYLTSRNWVQISLMGGCSNDDLMLLASLMESHLNNHKDSISSERA